MKNKPVDTLARAGLGAFMAASANGTVGQIDPDDMFEISAAMASSPSVVAESLGNDPRLGQVISPEQLQANILEKYYDEMFASELGVANDELAGNQQDMIIRRHDAANAYAGLTEDDIARIEFDRENGDDSAAVAVMEQFYLG